MIGLNAKEVNICLDAVNFHKLQVKDWFGCDCEKYTQLVELEAKLNNLYNKLSVNEPR